MDILQLIKATNKEIIDRLQALAGFEPGDSDVSDSRVSWLDWCVFTKRHLQVKKVYLYPEVSVVSRSLEKKSQVLESSLESLSTSIEDLRSHCSQLSQADFIATVTNLQVSVVDYLRSEEELLIPEMRQKMSTEEREELAEVFQDAFDQMNEGVQSIKAG